MFLPLSVQKHATFFSVYAPTLQADPAERELFYTDISSLLLRNIPTNDKIVILGETRKPGKVYLENMTLETTTTVGAYYLNNNCVSQNCLSTERQFQNHLDKNTDT